MKYPMPSAFRFWKWPRLYRIAKWIDLSFNRNQTYCRTCMRWSHGEYCPHC